MIVRQNKWDAISCWCNVCHSSLWTTAMHLHQCRCIAGFGNQPSNSTQQVKQGEHLGQSGWYVSMGPQEGVWSPKHGEYRLPAWAHVTWCYQIALRARDAFIQSFKVAKCFPTTNLNQRPFLWVELVEHIWYGLELSAVGAESMWPGLPMNDLMSASASIEPLCILCSPGKDVLLAQIPRQ